MIRRRFVALALQARAGLVGKIVSERSRRKIELVLPARRQHNGGVRPLQHPATEHESEQMELIIRAATPGDAETLCELFDEADQLHRDQLPDRFQAPPGPARDKAFLLGLLADQRVALFVGEREGTLLGLVQAAVTNTPPLSIFVPRCYVVVDTLVVKAGFRQQGIGQKLMEQVQQWALAKGATAVELNVYQVNQEAMAFYRQLGYDTLSQKMSKSLR